MTPLRLTGIRASVFDAYGTLFDVLSCRQFLERNHRTNRR